MLLVVTRVLSALSAVVVYSVCSFLANACFFALIAAEFFFCMLLVGARALLALSAAELCSAFSCLVHTRCRY